MSQGGLYRPDALVRVKQPRQAGSRPALAQQIHVSLLEDQEEHVKPPENRLWTQGGISAGWRDEKELTFQRSVCVFFGKTRDTDHQLSQTCTHVAISGEYLQVSKATGALPVTVCADTRVSGFFFRLPCSYVVLLCHLLCHFLCVFFSYCSLPGPIGPRGVFALPQSALLFGQVPNRSLATTQGTLPTPQCQIKSEVYKSEAAAAMVVGGRPGPGEMG